MKIGKINIGIGFLVLSAFMMYGFVLIYLRDFSPEKEAWIAGSLNGPHFESKLAHVHGNLFALLNIVIGYLLMHLSIPPRTALWVSRLALTGLLMPLGILSEVYFGLPPYLVLIGAVSIIASTTMFGFTILKSRI